MKYNIPCVNDCDGKSSTWHFKNPEETHSCTCANMWVSMFDKKSKKMF